MNAHRLPLSRPSFPACLLLPACLLFLLCAGCAARQNPTPDGHWLCDAAYSWKQMYPGKVFKEDIVYRALKENRIALDFARGEMRVESLSGKLPPQTVRFRVVRQEGNAVTIAYLDEPGRHEVFVLENDATLVMYNPGQPKVRIRYTRLAAPLPGRGE